MNNVIRILLGAVILAVFACLWYLLSQKNKGSSGCGNDCASCASPCSKRKQDKNE